MISFINSLFLVNGTRIFVDSRPAPTQPLKDVSTCMANPFLSKVSYTPSESLSDENGPMLQIHKLRELLRQLEIFMNTNDRLTREDAEFARHLFIPDILLNMEKINLDVLPPSLRDGFARLYKVLQDGRVPWWEPREITARLNNSIHQWLGTPRHGYVPSSLGMSRRTKYYVHLSHLAITQLSLLCVIVAGYVVGRRLLLAQIELEERTFGLAVIIISIAIVFLDALSAHRVKVS
jgi:hypothetical protein